MVERNNTPPQRIGNPRAHAASQSCSAEQSKGVIREAAAVLGVRHDVDEMAAYEMLVRGAADAGTSVREVAYAVVTDSASPTDRISPELRDASL